LDIVEGPNVRVLLIEDDSAMARSIKLMLRSEGINVHATDLGEEGIDLGKLHDYDIIVLDLELPDMSGFQVLKALRVVNAHPPVLVVSGNAMVETKVKALSFGADDYMTKPLDKDELVARIQSVVRRSEKSSSGKYENGILLPTVCEEHSKIAVAKIGGNYIGMEWETGYMLLDLDGGQVVVA
jgi:two-component system cell cycle response regulator CtrA